MDLKSMLNDSSSQRQPPRLHTPQTSYDQAAVHTPSYESHFERPPSYQPPLPSSEYRSSANGSYFAVQSPNQQNSGAGSAPGVTGQSMFAQSPGPQGQIHTLREGIPPSHPYQSPFAPSPSPSGPPPPTPGSTQPYPTPSTAITYCHPGAHPAFSTQSPRDEAIPPNGNAQPHSRTLSPQAQFHPPPATPLGPPASYPRPSPHPHRPISQGQESYRRSSVGSVGSTQSREYSHPAYTQADHSRSGSVQRTYSGEVRERERSIESVSPKTIPKPPPQRRTSIGRYQELQAEVYTAAQPSLGSHANAQPQGTPDRVVDVQQHFDTTPKSSTTSVEPKPAAQYQTSRPSPSTGTVNNMTPQSTPSSLPAQPSPPATVQPALKRSASNMSGGATTSLPPKRPRRDEVPTFAQSARTKPLRFIKAPPVVAPATSETQVKRDDSGSQFPNGQAQAQGEPRWEPSITNVVPYEDLTRRVCDWIFSVIGMAAPPGGGAMFEIEAKIGAIFDEQSGYRLSLPVETETIFNREKYRGRTSFKSSMDMAQHKLLNTFLNGLVQESMREAQISDRSVIGYDHPHEYDEFYELTEEGKRNLPPSIMTWLNPRHKPRIRRTIDEGTGQVKAQIIKSRMADLEVYNPGSDFDFRISISIESPWDGEPHWLTEMTDGGRDRKKDRMSYRHMAYQIDLTQVSYPHALEKEHELEVEISTEQIRIELANLQAQRPSRYEDLVKGFLDNVRILCRKGTVGKTR
ncbi:uncharacterized protein Z518_02195 [Rhinocladiella mackenziei CBS 650.93]|uniref:mRNA-capping enzyme subunit beta n=1 Tax=Rhinocladiella mackenziei CBS 650.93 TaxID=1442369 RepID=A0A0D2FZ58_9EURO|nr:uncharacterized protein Z518_02195 [Rhinocladiella mackenziei CBS 650.93]KIX07542.1 hypothetical protein Z518_02195 [Rhinocladiella mackenziei CBS 650.93]